MWGVVTRWRRGVALRGENGGGGGEDHEDAGGDVWSKIEEARRARGLTCTAVVQARRWGADRKARPRTVSDLIQQTLLMGLAHKHPINVSNFNWR